MKLFIYTVYDSKAEAFIQPFFSPNSAVACRSFSMACNEQGHAFNLHGGDYTLFELGTFDHDTALFELLEAPTNLGLALTFMQQTPTIETTPDLPSQITQLPLKEAN